MKTVILSIKPAFINLIKQGIKQVEFRKVIFHDTTIKTIYIYTSAPISKIVGKFDIDTIISGPKNDVWKQTQNIAGITHDDFEKYFNNKTKAHAIVFKNPILWKEDNYISLENFCGKKHPPQNFYYFDQK